VFRLAAEDGSARLRASRVRCVHVCESVVCVCVRVHAFDSVWRGGSARRRHMEAEDRRGGGIWRRRIGVAAAYGGGGSARRRHMEAKDRRGGGIWGRKIGAAAAYGGGEPPFTWGGGGAVALGELRLSPDGLTHTLSLWQRLSPDGAGGMCPYGGCGRFSAPGEAPAEAASGRDAGEDSGRAGGCWSRFTIPAEAPALTALSLSLWQRLLL
jgi:hypothetical protein